VKGGEGEKELPRPVIEPGSPGWKTRAMTTTLLGL
jgi:hypothetical protein